MRRHRRDPVPPPHPGEIAGFLDPFPVQAAVDVDAHILPTIPAGRLATAAEGG